MNSLLFFQVIVNTLVKAKCCCVRARVAGEGVRVTWDTTFLFLSCNPEGSWDARRELLTVHLLSAYKSCIQKRAWDLASIIEQDRG